MYQSEDEKKSSGMFMFILCHKIGTTNENVAL